MAHNASRSSPEFSKFLSTILTARGTNITTTSEEDLDLFFQCWIRPHCPACLSSTNPQYPCSWCATSQVCVPNTVMPYPFGILAPIKTDAICPLGWRERWELRARPFSCRCSSMTFVSVVVAVEATLVGIVVLWCAVLIGAWVGRLWRARKAGWWRPRNWVPRWVRREKRDASTETETEAEREPNANRSVSSAAAAAGETTPLLAA